MFKAKITCHLGSRIQRKRKILHSWGISTPESWYATEQRKIEKKKGKLREKVKKMNKNSMEFFNKKIHGTVKKKSESLPVFQGFKWPETKSPVKQRDKHGLP